ncbi:MAG: hypothetical protein OEU50_15515 [Gammaproteobacteria bacterium]|nr:hypothetical protein [Gammaproteobacteria bacterium]
MSANPHFEITDVSFDQAQRQLNTQWRHGHRSSFPYIWLRQQQFFPLMGRPEQQRDRRAGARARPDSGFCAVVSVLVFPALLNREQIP